MPDKKPGPFQRTVAYRLRAVVLFIRAELSPQKLLRSTCTAVNDCQGAATRQQSPTCERIEQALLPCSLRRQTNWPYISCLARGLLPTDRLPAEPQERRTPRVEGLDRPHFRAGCA